MKCETVNERMERKSSLLLEFVNNKGAVPKQKEVYKGENIGLFCLNIKNKGPTNQTYISTLASNEILSSDMNKTKQKKSCKEKASLLLDFVNGKGAVPKQKEVYKGVNVGIFWSNIKNKGPTNLTYISTLASNEILSSDMKKTKQKTSCEEKASLLLEFVNGKGAVPKQMEVYKGVNIGIFWSNIKNKGPTNRITNKRYGIHDMPDTWGVPDYMNNKSGSIFHTKGKHDIVIFDASALLSLKTFPPIFQ